MGIFSGSDPDIKLLDTRTAEQKGLSQLFSPYFSQYFGQGMEPYTGERVAGMSPQESMSMSLLSRMMGGGIPNILGGAETSLSQLMLGQPTTDVSPEATQRFFTEGIYNPMLQSMREDIVPGIEGAYAGNYWGTPRMSAVGGAWEDFERGMTGTLSELMYADEQARRGLRESAADRQLAASGAATQLGATQQGLGLGLVGAGTSLGSLPRMLEQARLDTEFSEYLRTLPQYSPVIEQALAFLGLPGLTPVVEPGQESAFPGMLSSLMLGVGMGGLGGAPGGGQIFQELTI